MRRGGRRRSSNPSITVDDGSFDSCGGSGWARDVESGLSAEQSHDDSKGRDGGYGLDQKIPSAPVSAPPFAAAEAPHSSQLSLYMVADKEYEDFLLSRRSRNRGGDGICGTNCGGDDVGRCCAGFSFIGMAFLLFVGILIQRQPLYVPGVKQVKGYPGTRHGMQWAKGGDSSGSSKMTWRYRGSTKYYEEPVDYKMRDESANAFKAAAAYFLTMVLSLIYAQNHHGINAAILPCILQLPHWVYDRLKSAYLRYRRRHYVEIPDTGSVLPITHRFRQAQEGVPIERKRTFELLRRKVVEMSMKISHITPKRRRRDLKTKNV